MEQTKETKKSYQTQMNELEVKIRDYINFGYFAYKPLGYKEIRITSYKFDHQKQKVEFILETKYDGSSPFIINLSQIDNFFNQLISHKPREINLQIEAKSQSFIYEGVKLSFTKDYLKFKYSKKNSKVKQMEELNFSISKFGNIMPIIVFKREDNYYQIIDGKKRFIYCMKKQQDIFYIDITSLIKKENILNEEFVVNTDILLNKKTLKNSWDDLCKYYYPTYRNLEIFFKENECEKYINKFHFILILESNIKKILNGETNFTEERIKGLWDEIKNYYEKDGIIDDIDIGFLKQNIFNWLKQNSKFYQIESSKEEVKKENYWFNKNIISIVKNPNNAELISELVLKGEYYNLIFQQNSKKFFFKEKYIKEDIYNIGSVITLNIDNVYAFINENNLLFEEILKSKIMINLDFILKEVLEEREELVGYDFHTSLNIENNEEYLKNLE